MKLRYPLNIETRSGLFRCADPEERRLKYMKAEELDKKFDAGEDITEFLDLSEATRPGQEQKR